VQAKLLLRDAQAQNLFGVSIAISGNTALIGATTADGGPGAGTGAAYVFVKGPTGRWTQQAKLVASDPAGTAKENFGFSVALDGDTAVVGAPNRGTFSGDPFGQAGAAYVFQRSGTKWGHLRRGVFFAALGGHDCSAGPQAPAQGIVMAVVPVVGSRAGARPKAGGLHG
jgi:hypothetical protein